MGLTTYGATTGTLTGTSLVQPAQGPTWNISTFSYTNPNVTVTTTTNHTLQVGNRVTFPGLIQAGTTILGSGAYSINAVTSNTFTFNFGATAPSAYTSGGIVKLACSGVPHVTAYLNNRYIFAFGQTYIYSQDGLNWDLGQLPSGTSAITSMAFDGTTYVFSAGVSGLWSSTTLAQGSWTQRSTFGTNFYCHDVKWYGGGINRFVAVGSSDATVNGAGGRIETSTNGTSWTNQTITGTAANAPYRNSAWDGVNTICAIANSTGGLAVSTSGAGSWVGYNAHASFAPDGSSTSGAPNMQNVYNGVADLIAWNPTASRWMTLYHGSNTLRGLTSTTTPTGYWTRGLPQEFFTGKPVSTTDTNGAPNASAMNLVTFADNFMYTYRVSDSNFQVLKWNATPTVLDTHAEIYTLNSVLVGTNIPTMLASSSTTTGIAKTAYSAVYGGGKWVVLQVHTSFTYPNAFIVTVFQ